jgi:hypothetical protein
MHSMREHVYGLDCCSFIAMVRKEAHITGKGSRIARHVYHPFGT